MPSCLLQIIHQTYGSVTTDVRGTEDITGISESRQLVLDLLKYAIDHEKNEGLFFAAGVPTSNVPIPSTTIGLVTNSTSPDAYAKRQLSEMFSALIATPCFAHNLSSS